MRPKQAIFNSNRLKLGTFMTNVSSGMAATRIPERWKLTWQSNVDTAKLLDEAGIEFMVPLARFRGYGGEYDYQGEQYEAMTWATGLLAHTRRLTVFSTVMVPMIHPVLAAKQLVTADHVGGGRAALNIVCGWNEDEMRMFGLDSRDQKERYEYGQEWWDIVRRIWASEEHFDHEGKYFKLSSVIGRPKLLSGDRMPVMNAGKTVSGRTFAVRNADMLFVILEDLESGRKEAAEVHAAAAQAGRKVSVCTPLTIVCRPTRREAEEFYRHYAVEEADTHAVDRYLRMRGATAHRFPQEMIDVWRERFGAGHGCYPIVGDPDGVAQGLARVVDAGFSGVTMGFVDYLKELPYFCGEVLPRLERMGLRQPAAAAA